MKNQLKVFLLIVLITIVHIPVSSVKADNERPRIVIASYSLEGDAIEPGKTMELNLTFINKDYAMGARGILITVKSDEDKLSPVYGTSNQIYINELKAGEGRTVKFSVDVDKVVEEPYVNVVFDMVYADYTGYNYNNQATIAIPVRHPKVLTVLGYTIPDTVKMGTKTSFSASYQNDGVDSLYSIMMNISGSGLEQPIKVNLNSLTPGTKSYAEAYLQFDSLGEKELTANFTYEDEEGNVYVTDTETFSVEVVNTKVEEIEPSDTDMISSSLSQQRIIQIGLLGTIFILFIIAILYYRKNKN